MRNLGLAGLLLSGIGVLSPAHAQEKTEILDNFDYASHRNVPAIDRRSYEGVIFNYNLLSDTRISQSDKKGVYIEPIWFYDIDNDGKFGKAEMDALKKGIPIFMHQEFNDTANERVRKFLKIASEYSEEKSSKNYEARIKELEEKILEYQAQILNQEGTKGSIKEKEEVKEEKKKKEYADISIITEANSNFALNNFGANVGLRFHPFKNKEIGLGALIGNSFGLNRTVDSYTSPLSAGRIADGTITDTNINSIGFLGELSYGPLFVDAEIDLQNFIRKTSEKILDSYGNIVKSNTNSAPDRQVAFGIGVGGEIPLGKFRPRLKLAYNTLNGPSFSAGCTFRLNKRKK